MERRKLTFRIKGENTFAPLQIFAVRKGAGPRVGALRSPPGRGLCLCLVSGQAGADTTRVTTPRAWTLWPCGDGHSPVGRENRGDPGSAPAPSHWSCGLAIYPGGREPGLRATTRPRGKSANPESTEEQVSYRTVCEKSPRCARANMEKREKGEVRCFQGRRSQHRLARSWLGARLRGGVRTFSFPLTMPSAISDDNLALKRLNLNFRRNNLNPQSTVLW